ncbi:MAG: hypothetical protein E8D46_04075 [Nitrospira sp.]|nr:MAG: hypothetical protein E8D46_04075 [Nitrospira sp.]
MIGISNPSWHISNAIFAKNLYETLVAMSRVTSHHSQTKTLDPFSSPQQLRDKGVKQMSGKTMLVTAGLCCIVIPGCTSLQSVRLDSQTNTPSGLTYRLPAKQFAVKAIYEITGCTVDQTSGKGKLDTKVSASFTESLIGAEAYTIDYQRLNALTKVANTEFQLSEAGLLTSVNASIADQTGAVIRNAGTAAASIARAIALPGAPGSIPPLSTVPATTESSTPPPDPCEQIKLALDRIRTAKSKLEAEKLKDDERAAAELHIGEMDRRIKAFMDLTVIYEKLGTPKDRDNLLTEVNAYRKELGEAEKKLKDLGESQTQQKTKELAEAKGQLVIVASKDFVPSIIRNNQGAITHDGLAMDVGITADDLSKIVGGNLDFKEENLPVVIMTLEIPKGRAIDINQGAIGPDSKKIGIAYRIPVAAVAKLHFKHDRSSSNQAELLLEKSTQIPQFGPIGSINLDNIVFDENSIELAFNGATGTPSKLTFRAKSKAESASATVRDAAGTYLQLQKDKRDDRIAANKALLEQATAQVTLDKAKSDLALSKVQANATAAKTEAELQQALVSAQLQLIRDQQRLDAVRTGTATSSEVELESLGTQEQLLIQRLKIMKLEQEIAEQKARNLSATVP